jgi:hypothetical protein
MTFLRPFLTLRGLLIALPCWASAPAFANYSCTGPVTALSTGPSGTVTVQSAGLQFVYVCYLYGTSPNGVTADSCKGIYSILLSARTTGANVTWIFNDSLTCTTQPAWAWLTTTPLGWYYGPQL